MSGSQVGFKRLMSLPNRDKFLLDIKKIDNKSKYAFTLLNIEIDNFYEINDYFGMDISSEIIYQISLILKSSLPTRSSKLYRFEQNKFLIFIPSRISLLSVNLYIKELISKLTKQTYSINSYNYSISLSAGVARGRKDLFRKSYLALNEAKKREKSYVIYNHRTDIEERFLKNIRMHHSIKEAIENDKVIALFQPIQNLKTGNIEKYEALIRIENQDGTYKSPNEFLDIAKKVKLYTKLTKKMIQLSLLKVAQTSKPVTINITMDDIQNPSISRYIHNYVKNTNLGSFITFEIVESKEITSFVKVSNFIKRLKALGCQFAIDDFGSGYSNFENILKLDFDYIKIDGSLIKEVDSSKQNELFVKTIVNMAKTLNIKTVAEYVYSKTVHDKVKELEIDYAQGYYIGKPRKNVV